MLNGHRLARVIREPDFHPSADEGDFKPWIFVPPSCAKTAVRRHHQHGAPAGNEYLAKSKVGEWLNHDNPSMASNVGAVMAGFSWYVSQDASDGRPHISLGEESIAKIGDHFVPVRLDVVLQDGDHIAARIVLWDGPDFQAAAAPLIACPFALGLGVLYPDATFSTIGIWQARRQHLDEVDHADACAHEAELISILDGIET